MYKWLSIGIILGLIGRDCFGLSKSEIIVSAENAIYCLNSDGNLVWNFSYSQTDYKLGGPTIGDINNDGEPEVLVGADKLYCLNYNGTLKWSYAVDFHLSSPVIANIDTTGNPEILIANRAFLRCLDSDCNLKWWYGISGSFYTNAGPAVIVANIDGIGTPEVLAATPTWIYCLDSDGILKWSYNMGGTGYVGIAVADLNLDSEPEIVVTSTYNIYCLRPNGSVKWSYSGKSQYISQPAMADINSDNKPEVVVYQYPEIIAFQENTAGTGLDTVWRAPVEDETGTVSASPPIICDIDGDGDKDVLWVGCIWNGYNPAGMLYILNGIDGKHPNNSGAPCYTDSNFTARTVFERGVAVADIDADGKVEIVGISSNGGQTDISGVAVLECDNSWASARNIFSSHLYHITEINDDLSIPKIEPNNWMSHNTWLTQKTTGGSGFGNPVIKWISTNSNFGWILASIAIAPTLNPAGVEEREVPEYSDLRVLYKDGRKVVAFGLSEMEEISFHIFDIAGRERKVINMGIMDAGTHEIPLNLANFKNGVYFCQAHLGEKILTCKTIVIR